MLLRVTKRFVSIQGVIAVLLLLGQLAYLYGCTKDNLPKPSAKPLLTVQKENNSMTYNKLSADEEQVIVNKGTEPPFSGKYYLNKEKLAAIKAQAGK